MTHLPPPQHPQHLAPLHGVAATRQIEHTARQQTPGHELIENAGKVAAQLALAIAPHARHVLVVCGPGHNGADGLIAASALRRWGLNRISAVDLAPPTATAARQWARQEALNAGVEFFNELPSLGADLVIDALLGIGARQPLAEDIARVCEWINRLSVPVLCMDIPSGLDGDTGQALFDAIPPPGARHTLSLLSLKPGLFTGMGRDLAGNIWHHALGCEALLLRTEPTARWWAPGDGVWASQPAAHLSHKGSHGDVMVIGGDMGQASGQSMVGAAVLTARAALHSGAGRVYLGLIGANKQAALFLDPAEPGLMLRSTESAMHMPPQTVLVCGCGAGAAWAATLIPLLASEHAMVLDADALNLIANDTRTQRAMDQRAQHRRFTVITPHPLEAARLCGVSSTDVQSQRLSVATQLSRRWHCVTVLKGCGTVVSNPSGEITINSSGNGRLATAGTGDVLAGMIGAQLARWGCSDAAVRQAVYAHGLIADQWNPHEALTATRLAAAARPVSRTAPLS